MSKSPWGAARAENAGHVTLHDTAYNPDRNIATGNPYKDLIFDLQKRDVKVELCGATAKAHGWGNEDLLADIKVNTHGENDTARPAGIREDHRVKSKDRCADAGHSRQRRPARRAASRAHTRLTETYPAHSTRRNRR